MKFCPKCGAQLVDEARFCSKCGAPQPNMENVPVPSQQQAMQPSTPQPTPAQQPAQMTPGQRYNYLKQNDERFRDTTKVVFLLKFVGLINLLFIIPFMVCYFTPLGTLTGVNAQDYGNNLLAVWGKTYPYNFNLFELSFTIQQWANSSSHKLTPGNALDSNIVPSILWFFIWIFIVLLALVAMLGTPRGYVLKTYDKDEGKELYKNLKKQTLWLFGPALAIIGLVNAIATYANCNSEYKDSTQYLFGVIEGYTPGLTTCIVVTAIFVVIMIAGSIVLRTLIFKKIDKYFK